MYKNMFDFLKNNKNYNDEQIKEYFDNIKDASLFLDKAILTFSSLFLGFLFNQLGNILKLNLLNINYLQISIISLGITIVLVLISYLSTIFQAKIGYKISIGKVNYEDGMYKFKTWDFIIDILRILYFITFIIPIIFTILFYITNLKNYVG